MNPSRPYVVATLAAASLAVPLSLFAQKEGAKPASPPKVTPGKPIAVNPGAPAAPGAPAVDNTPQDPKRLSTALGTFFANRQKSMPQDEALNLEELKKGFMDVMKASSADYGAGAQMAAQLKRDKIEVDNDLFFTAFKAAFDGDKPAMTQEEVQAEITKLQAVLQQRQMEARRAEAAKHEAEGKAFMDKNASAEGVQTTASGLQYKVLEPAKDANAPKPTAEDSVTCAYRGTLIDGTEFDKSPEGQDRTFALNRVVKGWTEGIPLMQVGSKYRFWVPASLGYGDNPRPGGVIKPGDTLVFDVELKAIAPKVSTAPAPTPGAASKPVRLEAGERAVATTPPIAVEMKDGKPVVTQVTPEMEAAAKKKAEEEKAKAAAKEKEGAPKEEKK